MKRHAPHGFLFLQVFWIFWYPVVLMYLLLQLAKHLVIVLQAPNTARVYFHENFWNAVFIVPVVSILYILFYQTSYAISDLVTAALGLTCIVSGSVLWPYRLRKRVALFGPKRMMFKVHNANPVTLHFSRMTWGWYPVETLSCALWGTSAGLIIGAIVQFYHLVG